MTVLLHIALELAFLFVVGLGLLAFTTASTRFKAIAAPFAGLVFTQLVFVALFIATRKPSLAFWITIAASALAAIAALRELRPLVRVAAAHGRELAGQALAVLAVIGITAWPVLAYDTFQGYWHSGALDLTKDIFWVAQEIVLEDAFRGPRQFLGYAYLGQAIQYTLPVFWLLFFGKSSITVLLVNYLALLVIMYAGLVGFLRHVIGVGRGMATLVAVLSLGNAFMATTFINYHAGTMMVMAVAFPLLYTWYARVEHGGPGRVARGLMVAAGIAFCLLAYNFAALLFFVFGIAAVEVARRGPFPRVLRALADSRALQAGLALAYVASAALFYFFIAAVSENNLAQNQYLFNPRPFSWDYPGYRQWELIRSPAMFMFYWGLIPSMTMGVGYHLFGKIYGNLPLFAALFAVSVVITLLAVRGAVALGRRHAYLGWTYAFLGALFPVFALFLDPYYTYKLLYITQAFFVLAVVWQAAQWRGWLRGLSVAVLLVLTGMNVFYLVGIENYDMYRARHNRHPEEFARILDVPEALLSKSYLSSASVERRTIYELTMQGARRKYVRELSQADYVVMDSSIPDISYGSSFSDGVVHRAGNMLVLDKRDRIVVADEYAQAETEPRVDGNRPVRMLHDRHTRRGIEYVLDFRGNARAGKLIEIGLAPEYSASYQPLDLEYRLNDERGTIKVNGVGLYYIPVSRDGDFTFSISYRPPEKLRSLFPLEQRMLIAKIFSVKLVTAPYERASLAMLNPGMDRAPPPRLLFGNGWYDVESLDFRWGGSLMELVADPAPTRAYTAELEIEPGPSLEKLPLRLQVRDGADQVLGTFDLGQRERVRVRCDPGAGRRCGILRLAPLADGRELRTDPRHLNLRVFSKTLTHD